MNWLRRLFAPKPNPYKAYYDAKWQMYQDWCNEQTCIGCGMPFKDRPKDVAWVTEECCWTCFENGSKTRRDETVRF